MKFHNGLDVQRLMKMLSNTLVKEQGQWKPVHYKSNTGSLVSIIIHCQQLIKSVVL